MPKKVYAMRSLIFAVLAVTLYANEISAQENAAQAVFEGPVLLDPKAPTYPLSEASRSEEGWVVLNFMVDIEGRPFEPTVVGSVGSNRFERESIKALLRFGFQPATLSGKPVEGSSYYKFVFTLTGDNNATSSSFVNDFEEAIALVEAGNREEAERLIQSMEEDGAKNLYEAAHLNLAKFQYASKYGTKLQQMEYLEKALSFENYDTGSEKLRYLPPEFAREARRQLLLLQIENNRYGEALATYGNILKDGDEEGAETFRSAQTQILALKNNDTLYQVTGETDTNGSWHIDLHKRSFHLDNNGNKIDEFKLLCDKKYVFFAFEVGNQYQIPQSWGACHLRVLGSPNASFVLDFF